MQQVYENHHNCQIKQSRRKPAEKEVCGFLYYSQKSNSFAFKNIFSVRNICKQHRKHPRNNRAYSSSYSDFRTYIICYDIYKGCTAAEKKVQNHFFVFIKQLFNPFHGLKIPLYYSAGVPCFQYRSCRHIARQFR